MNKNTITAIIIAVILIILALIIKNGGNNNQEKKIVQTPVNNVSIVDGKQIIEIRAKGGYTPRESIAQKGIPTILKINTSGTFDCSSSIRIPSLNIFKSLPQTGTTDIDLGINQVGVIQGSCGMGMYPFEIQFQ